MTVEAFRVDIEGATAAGEVAGAGPDLLWAHGLGSSRRDEDRRGLFGWATSGARVTRYDARGHGRTVTDEDGAPPTRWGWDLFAADMLAVATARALSPCVVGGTSLGSAAAVLATLRRPESATGLLLVTPPAIWADRRPVAETYRAGADLVEQVSLEALRGVVATSPLPPILAADPQQPPLALDVAEATFPAVLRGVAASDLPSPDELAGISVPTLILAWVGDPDHPVSSAEALASAIPHARLVVASDLAGVRRWPDLLTDLLRGASPAASPSPGGGVAAHARPAIHRS